LPPPVIGLRDNTAVRASIVTVAFALVCIGIAIAKRRRGSDASSVDTPDAMTND
jgi:hypothetical protein